MLQSIAVAVALLCFISGFACLLIAAFTGFTYPLIAIWGFAGLPAGILVAMIAEPD